MRKYIILIVICMIAMGVLFAQSDSDQKLIDKIIEKQDELYRSETSHANMVMEITTPHWERTLELEAWTEGMEKSFILIKSPEKEKGTATLRVGDEMWNYLPRTDKVMKIPPSMMMSSWMGSDFTNDDLVRESSLEEDYNATIFEPENPVDSLIYVRLTPKEDTPIVWAKIEFAVTKDSYLPVWEKFYNERDELIRVMKFKDVQTIGGKTIPTVMELIPQDEEGKTVVRYKDVEFNIPLDDDIFTLRNLKKTR